MSTRHAPDKPGASLVQTPDKPETSTDLVYRFKISRKATPEEFRNLWELTYKGPQDKEWHVEIDADALSTVISHINYIFEQDGL